MLQLQDLTFGYGTTPLFSGLSSELLPGVTLVQGGDGTGKTTLLRLLAGELAPLGGRIKGPRIGLCWLAPRAGDPPEPTPREWLSVQARRWGHWSTGALQDHLDGFALHPHLDKPWVALSTGSRRKVGLATSLASGAPLVLIDEPTAGLDLPSVRHLCGALDALADGPACLVVAHYEALPGVRLSGTLTLDPT